MKETFKTFGTIDRLLKQYSLVTEADGDDTDTGEETQETGETADEGAPEGGDDAAEDGAEPTGGDMPEDLMDAPEVDDAALQPVPRGEDPEAQADAESGSFVSDNKKAELVKMMLDALMANPPKTGEIPQQYLNVTVDNADDVMNFIQSLLTLETGLSDSDDSELKDDLKNI